MFISEGHVKGTNKVDEIALLLLSGFPSAEFVFTPSFKKREEQQHRLTILLLYADRHVERLIPICSSPLTISSA